MTLEEALALVAAHRLGVLITLRTSGQPHTSNVVYAAEPVEGAQGWSP